MTTCVLSLRQLRIKLQTLAANKQTKKECFFFFEEEEVAPTDVVAIVWGPAIHFLCGCDVESVENVIVDNVTTCLLGSESAECHFGTLEHKINSTSIVFEMGDKCVLKTCSLEQNISFRSITSICAKSFRKM